jgi:hypothetical protein
MKTLKNSFEMTLFLLYPAFVLCVVIFSVI